MSPPQVYQFARESTDSASRHAIPQPPSRSAPATSLHAHYTKEDHLRSSSRVDNLIPAKKPYLGLRRRTFFILVGALVLLVIGLAVGLAVGLRPKSQPPPTIPLPEYGGTHSANVTFYKPKPGPDACGKQREEPVSNVAPRQVVAMSSLLWDAVAATNSTLCGRQIVISQRVEYDNKGDPNMPIAGTSSSSYAIVDRCEECGPRDLAFPSGMSYGIQLVKTGEERAEVTWEWWTS